MEILLILLFFSVSCVAVGYPLLRREAGRCLAPTGFSIMEDLIDARESIKSALDDLDLDYALGTISEEDYRDVKIRYEREMRAIEERSASMNHIEGKAIDEAIERAVRQARERRQAGSGGRKDGEDHADHARENGCEK